MKRFIIPSLALAAFVSLSACGTVDESRDTTNHTQFRRTDNPTETNYVNPSIRTETPGTDSN